MTEGYDLLEVIDGIDPGRCSYEQWVQVGMALKDAGHSASDWEAWSRRDAERFRAGECEKKWGSFRGSLSPVTGGTVVALARSHGWQSAYDEGYELSWDAQIGPRDEGVVIKDAAWVEAEDIPEPSDAEWDPVDQLTTYLKALFQADENVGYVTSTWETDEGVYKPQKGAWGRTAGQLIEELNKCGGDIGGVLGDYRPEVGAWIRFNPLDGTGIKNENVTEFRYALVESDSMAVGKQLAIIKELELPCAVVVHSGKKSVHAIVRIDATDYDEYRKRVDHLYSVCRKNGLEVDSQNKNPSRLSRMPGVMRDGHKQFIVATDIGQKTWAEWSDWIEAETDVLPVDVTNGYDEWDDELEDDTPIIDGILGTAEKMMLSGSSKAGKSIALLELATAIANGDTWMGAQCAQGDVLYVNFELKQKSRKKRVREINTARGYGRESARRTHFLDLRGHSAPLEGLTSKIVRQVAKHRPSVIIIDPIYKVMNGDENNAEAVGQFCNQLDKLGRLLDCSIVYCHHYSKGQQGQKSSMDRASGSGVFARDADGLLAMTELEVTDATRKAYLNDQECRHIIAFLRLKHSEWLDSLAQDVLVVANDLRRACREYLPTDEMNTLIAELDVLGASVAMATAHRLESTLRDFAPHPPINVWYRYPVHEVDTSGTSLADAEYKDVAAMKAAYKKGGEANGKKSERKRKEKRELFEDALANAKFGDPVTRSEVASYIGEYDGRAVTKETIRKWMEKWPEFAVSGPEAGYTIVKSGGVPHGNS